MRVTTMEGLSSIIQELAVATPLAVASGKEAAARVIKAKVDALYGDESKLAPISQDSTAQIRSDGGAGGPLYIDGSLLKDSVTIEDGGPELSVIGSSEPIHAYHEYGYITSPASMIPNKVVPGRPVFHRAAAESEPLVAAMFEEEISVAFTATIRG